MIHLTNKTTIISGQYLTRIVLKVEFKYYTNRRKQNMSLVICFNSNTSFRFTPPNENWKINFGLSTALSTPMIGFATLIYRQICYPGCTHVLCFFVNVMFSHSLLFPFTYPFVDLSVTLSPVVFTHEQLTTEYVYLNQIAGATCLLINTGMRHKQEDGKDRPEIMFQFNIDIYCLG